MLYYILPATPFYTSENRAIYIYFKLFLFHFEMKSSNTDISKYFGNILKTQKTQMDVVYNREEAIWSKDNNSES